MLSSSEAEGVYILIVFFFNDTATTEIYTLSLHDALPIYIAVDAVDSGFVLILWQILADNGVDFRTGDPRLVAVGADRKSTRLNSSHANISYAVFCLKKKKTNTIFNLILITSLI